MELWDVLDRDGNPTGRTVARHKIQLKNGEYHLVVHIWILDKKGRVLLQRRADDKPLMPGEWAATGGAAIAGENSMEAARREVFEELGVATNEQDLQLISRIVRKNSFLDVYLLERTIPLEDLVLQRSEVAQAKWVPLEKFKQMVADGEYHNYGKAYFKTIFSACQERIPNYGE